MLGVILCGGKSSRMGTDKGLINSLQGNTITWAEIACNNIRTLELPFVLSVNKEQYTSYRSLFSAEQLIPDNETLQIRGPLYGLLSVHMRYPNEALFVLACDMPLMKTDMLKELLQEYNYHSEAEACLYTNNGEPEPLCAIYKTQALQHILQLYHSGKLTKHSMKFMLDHISTHTMPLKEEQKNSFQNFNAHSELNGL